MEIASVIQVRLGKKLKSTILRTVGALFWVIQNGEEALCVSRQLIKMEADMCVCSAGCGVHNKT